MDISIVKRDGSRERFDADKINRSIEKAALGLPDALSLTMQIAGDIQLTLHDGITSADLDEVTIGVAAQNIKDAPEFDVIATRLRLKTIYKTVLGSDGTVEDLHADYFPKFILGGVGDGLLDPRLVEKFDLDVLADRLRPARDDLFRYIGVTTMRNRYFVTDVNRKILETPQIFWMRVAMGLSVTSETPMDDALAIYDKISTLEYLPAGSTLVNAGTINPQLSNCFVIDMEDDIDHISHTLTNVMKISKGTGGIGLAATKLRASGSPIRSNNTASTGPIPFLHTIDSTLRAISRGGKKFGATCVYMENWHLDFHDFLDLRENTGDPYRRLRTANTAVWISDEFMKRVAFGFDWYLFDPLETPDLTELYGAEFSKRYNQYCAAAERGEIANFHKMSAKELWIKILVKLQTTSHPWITFKDAGNIRALNNNTGTIHLSNLCTEIFLPQDRDNISVCNLASINLSTHLVGTAIDWDRLAQSVRVAVRHLDNLVDVTRSGIGETERSNDANRAVGLGLLGFTDVVERLGFSYESQQSYDLSGQITEFISWHAIDESCNLAESRGAYENFAGSRWSQGMVPIDTLDLLEQDRSVPVQLSRKTYMDWNGLRGRVQKGIRNATLMAIAPTASIGVVAGTTPGFDPQFSQLFSRQTSSGKFLEVNRNLVAALRAEGLWETKRSELLAARGDLDLVEGIPQRIRDVFQTSFNLAPSAFINVAARAQAFVDQGIARNMYLENRDITAMSEVYMSAWRSGLKSTYYAHFKPRQNAEQSTVKVNKTAKIETATAMTSKPARRGFGGRRVTAPAPVEGVSAVANEPTSPVAVLEPPAEAEMLPVTNNLDAEAFACPMDPAERAQCEACQ